MRKELPSTCSINEDTFRTFVLKILFSMKMLTSKEMKKTRKKKKEWVPRIQYLCLFR
uniref:Uncharacterized protein n=1 Tax=Marmota marmota marmota TaxID=9994 RepID=A0A8C5YZY4_MARMA